MGLRKIKTEILDLPSIIFGIHLTLDFAKTRQDRIPPIMPPNTTNPDVRYIVIEEGSDMSFGKTVIRYKTLAPRIPLTAAQSAMEKALSPSIPYRGARLSI